MFVAVFKMVIPLWRKWRKKIVTMDLVINSAMRRPVVYGSIEDATGTHIGKPGRAQVVLVLTVGTIVLNAVVGVLFMALLP